MSSVSFEGKTHAEVVAFAMGLDLPDCRSLICPHPATERIYHKKKVSIYVCQMCKYAVREKWYGGISCGYNENNTEDSNANNK